MALIKLNYGPYEANGIIRHRPQRLHGLITSLTLKGYGVELVPSEHINRLTVDMFGVTVFRCDIRNLLFNILAEDDIVCQRALEAIDEASKRIINETNVPKFVSVDEGMRYLEKRKLYQTEDYLTTSDVGLLFEIRDDLKNERVTAITAEGDMIEKIEKIERDETSAITETDPRLSMTETYDKTTEVETSIASSNPQQFPVSDYEDLLTDNESVTVKENENDTISVTGSQTSRPTRFELDDGDAGMRNLEIPQEIVDEDDV